jgi:hypothetical protein
MKTKMQVFTGKQAANNKFLLETLYNTGPLSAWDLTKIVREKNRMSLHSVFNKRLRILEKKGYVKKAGRKWILQFKGTIAVLISQKEPKPWNEKWTEIFENYVSPLRETPKRYSLMADGEKIVDFNMMIGNMPDSLKVFESWIGLANEAKKLIEKGLVNFDIIKNKSLVSLIITEILTTQKIKKGVD